MDRVEFEGMLVRVVSLGCAENVDWLFEHHGDVGMSKSVLDNAINMAICRGHLQVARTLQARGEALVRRRSLGSERFEEGDAHVGGRTVVGADEIVSGEKPVEPQRPAVSVTRAVRVGRHGL